MRPVNMGRLSVVARSGVDGATYLKSPDALPPYGRSLIDKLDHWAEAAPERTLFADRGPDGNWRHLSYKQAKDQSRAIAQFLIERELSADRPVAVLSGNSIEHAVIVLGAMRAGVPVAPVSPAYSLVAKDYAKLKHVFELVTPGLVFCAEGAPFETALAAVMRPDMVLVNARNALRGAVSFETVLATKPTAAVDEANRAVNGDTVAKFLFTSGSTGMPKAVINTQRMICANQVMIAEALAFLKDAPPVLVDWLPWNHTAGGNHNFGIAIHNGGTLYIDDGNPTPAGIAKTVRNLEDVAPTLYFNVPKGYEMLVEHLAKNDRLRDNFFSKVELLQYAGAGLPQHVWDALEDLARRTVGKKVMIITGYGSTETAPFALTTTWPVGRPGEVGLPAPGLELKLLPNEEKLELRLKGPNITPGYWRQPDKTAESFDEEGFYKIGDALKFVDPGNPARGLLFDGRVAEDFKLSTGTWVNMSAVRGSIISAFAPYVRDAVLTGLNLGHIGALLFLDADAARKLAPELAEADDAALAASSALRSEFRRRLDALAAKSTGSSSFVARIVVLDSPPSIDLHEVTDKGSINQRAVMAARAQLVEDLYAEPSPPYVLVARKERT
ncbi:MAG: feruloyl-CoA synthase, partial [Brucellaceae bacterium]|nr:feruloyl-CoA synthase [Brucellaceae bacterium]